MARIRTIKPEFQNSQSMGRVSRDARLTFIELWPQCDDAGRLRANSRMLASVLFPYDEDAPKLIDGWLAELENEGCIVRYTHGNDEYLAICHWDHQKIDHPKASLLPAPPEKKPRKSKLSSRERSRHPREASQIVRAVSSTVPEGNGKDQTLPPDGGGACRSKPKPKTKTAYTPEFEEFWRAYDPPKNATKIDAFKAWTSSEGERPDTQTLIRCVEAYRAWLRDETRKRRGQECPAKHPSTWLNKRAWEPFLASGGGVVMDPDLARLHEIEAEATADLERALHGDPIH